MTILESIKHSKSLLHKISSYQQVADNTNLAGLVSALSSELDTINSKAAKLIKESLLTQKLRSSNSKPEIKSGCYIFTGEKGFFCPSCYDNSSQKIPTKRMNSKLRVCPSCRSSITC